MILKKPYAFLIKHFRIIHLLLLLPMIYLIIKTKTIVSFFSSYVAYDYSFSFTNILSGLASNYINIFMYVAVIVILTVLIALYFLLQNKEKPTKFYSFSIIYYIGIFILLTTCINIFGQIEEGTLNFTMARIIRDVFTIIHYSQYIFIILFIIRGVGFNIKKFNFENDLNNLEISSEDDEEFEFLVGKDSYKTKRTIRRFFRELGYYYKENKFIFTIIFIVAFILIGSIIYSNYEVRKVYKENESFAFGYINVKIKDSFISDLTLNGKSLNKGKTYLILELELTNRYHEDKVFNDANLRVYVNKRFVSPTIYLGNYFKDYGNPYTGAKIKANSTTACILVYELNKGELEKKYSIVAYSGFNNDEKHFGPQNKNITIKPSIEKSKINTNNIIIGANMNFKTTNLKDTNAIISSYEISNRVLYTYKYCVTANNCYDARDAISITGSEIGRFTFLVFDYELSLDANSKYMNAKRNFKDFFEDFMEINYKIGDKNYNTTASVYNKGTYDEKLIVKVPSNITNADSINAIITVRNLAYNIRIK